MKLRISLVVAALGLACALVPLSAQQSGGAFLPSFGYDISGAWNFSKPLTGTSLAMTGAITSSGGGIGYATGAGGAVTQITSRTTGVTLSKLSGTIQTDTSSLAAEAGADFIVTNTLVAIGDVVVVAIRSGAVGAMTVVSVSTVTAGTFTIRVTNNNAAAGAAETGAIIINFAVVKSVSA